MFAIEWQLFAQVVLLVFEHQFHSFQRALNIAAGAWCMLISAVPITLIIMYFLLVFIQYLVISQLWPALSYANRRFFSFRGLLIIDQDSLELSLRLIGMLGRFGR